jgi:hypothetical protein
VQYHSRVAKLQTTTVEVDAVLLQRSRREAEKRGITLKEFVDDALRRFLASEEHWPERRAPRPRLGLGRSTDGLSAADITAEPVARGVEMRRAAAKRARGMLADDTGRSTADEFIAERREEGRAEDREEEVRRHRG